MKRETGKLAPINRKVPADLYHGKIKETGDRDYWNDPGNLKHHKETEI